MVYRLRGEKLSYLIILEMSYFRLWLIRHYCKSHWKLFLISKRNIYEGPIRVLVGCSFFCCGKIDARNSFKTDKNLLIFFLPIPKFPQVHFSFFSFRIFLIRGLNLNKPFSDIWFYENVFHIYFFSQIELFCDTKAP